jgi:signal transduction histidine kinase
MRLEASQAQLHRLSGHLQAAREEERVRLAREIHDELGQALIGLKLDVAYLIRSLHRLPAAAVAKLEQMAARIDETVRAVRRLSAELRPSILDDLGLIAAMEWQIEEFRSRTRMECTFQSPGTDTVLDPDRATALFRILQEALTNIARHSGATRAQVRLDDSPEGLSLTVQDNGRGVRDEEIARSHSFGVQGIQERVHLLQGQWSIRGVPGQGTTVQVTIPRGPGGPA